MAKLLYSATDSQGKSVKGFVEAETAAQAMEQLRARNLRDIALHQEVTIAGGHGDLESLTKDEVEALAAFKVKLLREPGLLTVLGEVARRYRWVLLFNLALGLVGLAVGSIRLPLILLGLSALPFLFSTWAFRKAHRYNQLIKAHAVGDWSRMETLASQLRSAAAATPMLDFDLDIRLASAQARQGKALSEVLPMIEPWADKLAGQPGLYDIRVAAVHAAAEDRRGFVQRMRAGYEASKREPSRAMDLALAEARFGDVDEAEQLLNGVDSALLPAHATGFIHWARGVIALKRAKPEALKELSEAVRNFLMLAEKQPAVWTALAFCAGDQAMALHAAGRGNEARSTLKHVWPILRAHADKPFLHVLTHDVLSTGNKNSRD